MIGTISARPIAATEPRAADQLCIRQASLTYQTAHGARTHVIDNLDLTIREGEFVSLVGPSGCGKSTLLMMIGGLLRPTAGSILLNGREVNSPRPDEIGIVFQDSSLLPWRTAIDNVAFPLELRGVAKEERHRRARDRLDLVGLQDAHMRYPRELSGGMKQRVSIARGLVQEPTILLMDEPFGALDEQTRMKMGEELLRIWERVQSTVVFVTHSLSEAIYLSDRIVLLGGRPGKVLLDLKVPFGRPRDSDIMGTPEFGAVRNQLWKLLRDH